MPLAKAGPNSFDNGQGIGAQKIRLRRVPTKQEIIKKNLSNLQQNVMKKKAAQEYYYNQRKGFTGRSPLKRQGFVTDKSTIQNRLGVKGTMIFTNKNQQQKKMRQNILNASGNQNTQFFRTKRRNIQQVGQKVTSGNNISNNRMQRFTKKQSVQQRLSQIRQNTPIVYTQNVQNKIRLRRQQPVNYEIQVQNNGTNMVVAKKKQSQIGGVLNPRLQAEIKAIQTRVPAVEILPASQTPQPSVTFGTTSLTLNERFTELM